MARRQPAPTWPPPLSAPPTCALCGRETPRLTEHHLLPRSQGRRQGLKVTDLPTTALCAPCHSFVHRTFTNAQLASDYRDLDALRAHEDVRRFVNWVRRQPPTRTVRVR